MGENECLLLLNQLHLQTFIRSMGQCPFVGIRTDSGILVVPKERQSAKENCSVLDERACVVVAAEVPNEITRLNERLCARIARSIVAIAPHAATYSTGKD